MGMLVKFLIRWALSSAGLAAAAGILGPDKLSVGDTFVTLALAGFFLAIVNIFLKPITILLSLPAILISLGLFMVVVNGLMVLAASKIYHPLFVADLWSAILAGLIIGVVNFLITQVVEGL